MSTTKLSKFVIFSLVLTIAKGAVVTQGIDVNPFSESAANLTAHRSIWDFPGSRVQAKFIQKASPEYLSLFVEETRWYNDIVLFGIPVAWRKVMPHTLESWLRNYIAGVFVYFSTGGIWSVYVYWLRGDYFYSPGTKPTSDAILKQITVSMKSMPLYVSLPTLSEYMVENGWTHCYSQIEEVGFAKYLGYFLVYMVFVEFGIYWMHRLLHDIKPLYKYLHATHHIYNKQNTLSPFASLAFHPLDGILQACPHVIALFVLPVHFFTHVFMLFMEAIWATNIHDNINENMFPMMGAGYHTIHHTTYKHNYGHFTVWMDWMFGTLMEPREESKKSS